SDSRTASTARVAYRFTAAPPRSRWRRREILRNVSRLARVWQRASRWTKSGVAISPRPSFDPAQPAFLTGVRLALSGADGGDRARRGPGYLTEQDWRNCATHRRPRGRRVAPPRSNAVD